MLANVVLLSGFTLGCNSLRHLVGGRKNCFSCPMHNGAMTLNQHTTLADSANGAIAFNATVNGAHSLDVDTGGATTFGALVGNTTPSAEAAANPSSEGGEPFVAAWRNHA